MGRYCIVEEGAVIRPPCKIYKGEFSHFPMRIGDYCHVGRESIVEAASIGNHVFIGARAVIGKFAVIKDCCYIAENVIVPPYSVIAPFSQFMQQGIIIIIYSLFFNYY